MERTLYVIHFNNQPEDHFLGRDGEGFTNVGDPLFHNCGAYAPDSEPAYWLQSGTHFFVSPQQADAYVEHYAGMPWAGEYTIVPVTITINYPE